MNSEEIIKKHLSPDVEMTLKNEDGTEDTIKLKPLTFGQQLIVTEIFKLTNNKEDNELSDNEIAKKVFDLSLSIIKRSLPELDDETAENFVLTNLETITNMIPALIPTSKNKDKLELIKKMKEDVANRKNDGN